MVSLFQDNIPGAHIEKYLHYNFIPVAVFNYEVLLNGKQSYRELKQFILNTINNRETQLLEFKILAYFESSVHTIGKLNI